LVTDRSVDFVNSQDDGWLVTANFKRLPGQILVSAG
jgi:hypothetical protein